MTSKYKKYIPYIIVAVVILIISVLLVIVLNSVKGENVQETTTEEPSTLFMNGEVPYYSDVPASAYKTAFFVLDEDSGRMTYTDSSVKYVTGIDVSSHQGEIDWDAVAADGIDFVMVRIGYRGYGSAGNICEDEMSEANIKGAADAGLKVGVYFYSQATTVDEAVEEADFILNIIEKYDVEYPVVFDWENEPEINMRTDNMTEEMITACANAFCAEVEKKGYVPAIYFNLSQGYYSYNLSKINNYPFWYAQHEGEVPEFYYNYTIWQYSETGSVDGIDGYVDLNICFSDFSDYKAIG